MATDHKVASAEAQLQATLNVIPAYAWYALPSGGLIFVNERTADYLGLPKDHPLRFGMDTGAAWDSHIPLLHPDDHDESRNVWSACLRTGSAGEISFRVRDARGGYRWFLCRVEPLQADDGTLLYWIGVTLDIDNAKRAEEALQRSEASLADAQRLSHTGSWAFNAAGFEYWSSELFRIHGLDPTDKPPTAEEYLRLIHPEDRQYMAQAIQKMLTDHRGFDFTKRIVRPDGNVRHVRCVGSPVTQGGAFQGFVGSAVDVTEQEQLTEALRRSEFYLAEGQRLGHAGSWAFNPGGYFEHWSQELFQVYGLDPAKGAPTLERYLATIHPQDRDFMAGTIKRMHEQGTGCDVKKRIIRPDGALRHIRCVGIPVFDSGSLKGFVGTAVDITEQEQLTQELRRREAYLEEAQKLSQTGSFGWRPDSGESVWTAETYRIFEYDPAETPTLNMMFQRIHPQDRALAQQCIDRVSRSADVENECRLVMPSGAIKHVHVRAHALRDSSGNLEVVGAVTDITGRRRAEQTLRQSEAYLAEAQRLSRTGSFAWSPTADTTYFSEECYRVLGFEPQGAGPPRFEAIMQRIHPDEQARSRELVENSIRDKVDLDLEYRIVHPDRRVRDIHCVGHVVLDRSGELVEIVGTVIDITERKHVEEERERFRQMESDLAHVNRVSMLGELAASLSHEIKQPIAAAITNANACLRWLARDEPDLLEAREAASRIVQNGDRAADVINRVRSFYTKSAPADRERVDVSEVVDEMLGLLRGEANRYSIPMRTEIAGDLPRVMADRVQLQQVLMNLMLNGIEAMKDTDGELTIKSELGRDGQVLISVGDTGVGLPAGKSDQMFDAFFTTKPQGSGMGLAISRSIVESHGGRLWADSNVGRGATFSFTLPTTASRRE